MFVKKCMNCNLYLKTHRVKVHYYTVQHNTRPLVRDEYNLFAGKLKIFLLVRGDEWVIQLNLWKFLKKEKNSEASFVSCELNCSD